MTILLHLYSTSHCHLCDQAENLLASLSKAYDMQWSCIEIADNPILLQRYELMIPVLKRLDNDIEIYWPFTIQDIQNLLEK